MLSAAHRMRESEDFRVAVRRGARTGSSHLVVHLALPDSTGRTSDDPPAAAALVGFVVPKSVGVAVVRNRVKRRLRHLVRARVDRLPDGSRLVVRALPASATASSVELADSLDTAWRQAERRAAAASQRSGRPSAVSPSPRTVAGVSAPREHRS
ncbi:ribonuclease P protein component [Miniimonas arenae]|uniref:Ribonuclease P protein component n=1 Tax=Miniimonas arenae TaxID=676201 RepID=A0A5C5BBP9_9MICO|nr:ribonuclease P protein component [Miniimonas arenae]TNU73976.1 ribonuclease P protein component [Miniimonas arenae]